jgi:ribonuclease P protein subunit RPR2
MITLIQDQFARILLLPLSPLQNGRMARDFIRDELHRGFRKNQCQHDDHYRDSFSDQVMSFMGGKNARRSYGKTRAAIASVASERFQILLDQAKKMAWTDQKLSRRYVNLARKISSRTKVRIPSESKMYLCKGCGLALIPGHNAKIRLHAHTTGIVISCLSCGAVKRYPVSTKNRSQKGSCAMNPYIAESDSYPKKKFDQE